MQARRASRELALIIFSQIGKDIEKNMQTATLNKWFWGL